MHLVVTHAWRDVLKIGDIVKLIGTHSSEPLVGLIVSSSEFSKGWHSVACADGVVQWPESQMELVNESR